MEKPHPLAEGEPARRGRDRRSAASPLKVRASALFLVDAYGGGNPAPWSSVWFDRATCSSANWADWIEPSLARPVEHDRRSTRPRPLSPFLRGVGGPLGEPLERSRKARSPAALSRAVGEHRAGGSRACVNGVGATGGGLPER